MLINIKNFDIKNLAKIILVAAAAMCAAPNAFAQIPGAEKPAAEKPAEPAPAPDPLGRDSPAGMVAGFLGAVGEQNYDRAGEYFDLSEDPSASGSRLARQLRRVLDHGGNIYSRLRLSSNVLGDQNDGLKPDQEVFGNAKSDAGDIDLLATRIAKDKGGIWLISAQTVAQIPLLSQSVVASLLDDNLPQNLRRTRVWGAPVGHWIVMAALILIAYGIAWTMTSIIWAVLLRSRTPIEASGTRGLRFKRTLHALEMPIRLLIAVWIFWIAPILLGVSIIARSRFIVAIEIVGLVAIAWILWRVVDAVADYFIQRMTQRGRMSFLSATTFVARSVKFALAIVTIIIALDALGFNVTAGLAALGIGGLAIALGAQKTVENLVGSLTLLADQPVRVGDVCKFGDTVGAVEDIGMRSTRIRTNDRTLVTIPNGQFSSLQIENYSRRDKFWFHPAIDLRYETTHAQMTVLLAGIRELLRTHPKVDPNPARVNFISLGQNALRLEVFAFIQTTDNDLFLNIQEELFLKIMELVERTGAGFASASQTVLIARDSPAGNGKLEKEDHDGSRPPAR